MCVGMGGRGGEGKGRKGKEREGGMNCGVLTLGLNGMSFELPSGFGEVSLWKHMSSWQQK